MANKPRAYVSEIRLNGRAEGAATVVLRVLELRGVAVADEARRRILECRDFEMLDNWLDRVLTVTTIDELFG